MARTKAVSSKFKMELPDGKVKIEFRAAKTEKNAKE